MIQCGFSLKASRFPDSRFLAPKAKAAAATPPSPGIIFSNHAQATADNHIDFDLFSTSDQGYVMLLSTYSRPSTSHVPRTAFTEGPFASKCVHRKRGRSFTPSFASSWRSLIGLHRLPN